MFKNLRASSIGIRGLPLPDIIQLAAKTGFAGIDFDIREAATLVAQHGLAHVRALFADHQIIPGQWSLPVAWKEDARWQEDLAALPELAAIGVELGCRRTTTWIFPGSDVRPYAENFAWHVNRLRPIAQVLQEQGCHLGIEFVGPKTMRAPHRYPFIYTWREVMQLASEIGTGNVALLLDAWHLYTSGGTLDELDHLTAEDIIVVHISDAPANVPLDEQQDQARCLPLDTGVIDLPGFLRKLQHLGYQGPVTTEPFNRDLNALAAQDPLQAATLVSTRMDQLWQLSGLPGR